ncbi:MAG: polysaccharide deacetylase family protein [Leptospirales bacterium]
MFRAEWMKGAFLSVAVAKNPQNSALFSRLFVSFPLLCFNVLLFLFLPSTSHAGPGSHRYQRTILVLFNGVQATQDKNNFRSMWEFPLNFLGLKAEYLNLSTGPLPSGTDLNRFTGVALALSGGITNPSALWAFMEKVLVSGKRLMVLGDMPPYRNRFGEPFASSLKVLSLMGFRRMGHWDRKNLRYSILKGSMIGFELPPHPLPPVFRPLSSVRPLNRVWLGIRSAGRRNLGIVSTPIVTGPFGGIALDPFITREFPLNPGKEGWIVNPFRFLEAALDIRRTPRMDLTTLNGNRIFYSQVDGDGFETLSRYREGRMCSEVLYKEIFTHYSLPFSVSVILSQIDPHYQGTTNRMAWAKKIFSLSNIEAASHTFSHPFYWVPTEAQRAEGPVHIHVPGYHFNLDQEIGLSLDWMNQNLLPSGKKAMLYQWSGNTRPGIDALRKVWEYPILNLNGSDTRLDTQNPSYLSVFPYYRKLGPYVQFYNSDANEFIMTHDWKGPYFAFENILETFLHTDSPRRVEPVNVYFHFYIAQKEASLQSLKYVLDRVDRQRISPLFPSEFVRIEEGFINAHIHLIHQGSRVGWRISHYGKDTTVRFDHASGLYPDLDQSQGILGYRHKNGSLYLFLALRPSSRLFLTTEKPSVPVLHSATGYLILTHGPGGTIEFTYKGWVPGDRIELSGLEPGTRILRTPCESGKCRLRVNPKGILKVSGIKKDVSYRLSLAS